MTCHKKCLNKCQATAVCVPCEDDSRGASPAKGPEIVTTDAEGDLSTTETNASSAPQVSFQAFIKPVNLILYFEFRVQRED